MNPQFVNDEPVAFFNSRKTTMRRKKAHMATITALQDKSTQSHSAAATAHEDAASCYREEGDEDAAIYHDRKAAYHRQRGIIA